MIDFSIFTTAEAWISLVTLLFLEIILGVDNLVFISITSARLPEEQQHLGRRLGLLGAMAMRIVFLCFASYLVHMTQALFSVDLGFFRTDISMRDLVLLVGGLYLVYKGATELLELLSLKSAKEGAADQGKQSRQLTLPKAVGTIMVMDIVFSIDSVITAVGLADHLIIMILAVVIAIVIMMAFIDPISDFIERHAGMKILALLFIAVIGVLLVLDSLDVSSGVYVLDMSLEKLVCYFCMFFAVVVELLRIAHKARKAS